MLIGEETNDRNHTEGLRRLDPALDFAHTDGLFAAAGISGTRGAVELTGNDGAHGNPPWRATLSLPSSFRPRKKSLRHNLKMHAQGSGRRP